MPRAFLPKLERSRYKQELTYTHHMLSLSEPLAKSSRWHRQIGIPYRQIMKEKQRMEKNEGHSLSIVRYAVIIYFASSLFLIVGCERKQEQAAPPVVTVAKVTQMTVPVYLNYVGNTQAVRSVDIVARVEGFLWERHFIDGGDVKEGDLLFVIDPRQYQASLDNE